MGALASLLRRKRRTLFLLALTASVLYLLSSPSPSYLPSLPWSTSASHDEPLGDHPIDHLIHKNKRLWNEKLARQSRTLKEAQKEYRRRYDIAPPPFFDEWFQFAQENGHRLPDEYDTLTRSLLPFHALPPSVLRERTEQLGHFLTFSLVKLHANQTLSRTTVAEGDSGVETSESVRGRGWLDVVELLVGLPGVEGDMMFAVNERAEPRAVLSWDERKEAERIMGLKFPPRDSPLYKLSEPFPDWKTWMNKTDWGWSAYTRSCPPASPAVLGGPWPKIANAKCEPIKVGQPPFEAFLRASDPVHRYPLIGSKDQGEDDLPEGPTFQFSEDEHGMEPAGFCWHPEKRFDHGHFYSDFRNVFGLFPALTPGVMHGYSDIPIPSNYHSSDLRNLRVKIHENVREKEDGGYEAAPKPKIAPLPGYENDESWGSRRNELYWRGGATGGGSTPAGFTLNFQRHRLVRRFGSTQDTTPEPIVLPLQPNVSDSALAAYQIPRNEFNAKAFNIGFTSKVGCGIPACCEMLLGAASDLKFAAKDPWAAVKKFKMIIDVDGMGFSARFLQLFNSGAAVVKHTIYREYTSDWLQPWVHFIPVSPELSELSSIWTYFLGSSLFAPLPPNPSLKQRQAARALTSAGDRRLKEIAEAGVEWREEVDRPDLDWAIYAYRLIIEWKRLWDRTDEEFYAGKKW